jgi:hypothetical protein
MRMISATSSLSRFTPPAHTALPSRKPTTNAPPGGPSSVGVAVGASRPSIVPS